MKALNNAKFNIRHLDNTTSSEERKEILQWFKKNTRCNFNSVEFNHRI
jgi:superfamily II DNA or RNA helicase